MRRLTILGSACLSLTIPLITGCGVKQDNYDKLLMTNRSLEEQIVRTEEERDTARANLGTVRDQLGKATSELNGLKRKYGLAEDDLKRMGTEYDELMRRVSAMDFGPLPAEMENALEELAAQYPELLTFDAKRGMLRYASDFTFDLGSAELKPNAADTLVSLAKILNTPIASNFEVRIVGHTDTVPISRPDTRAKHPTNRHLSVHRAISVCNTLASAGVNPVRIQVAGYGEHRPVVPNPATGGAAQNRRVEIFLLPMPESSTSPTTPVTAPAETDSEPMK